MGKLIDADVFDSILQDAQAECKKNGGNFRFGVLNSVRANLANQPAVDAAPVVRCAYCKHCFDLSSDPMEPYDGESEWYCERFDRDTSAYEIDPYRFFCADGERRDDDALSGR